MAQPATEEKKVQEISEKLQETVDNVLKGDALEEAFTGFIIKDIQMKKACCWEILKPHWNTIPQDYHEAALKQYVKCVYDRAGSSKRVQLLFDMLEELVKHSLVSPKVVCECLLLCDGLTWKKEDLWCQTMHLIRRIIGGVDYKGVRDVLRIILERTATIPSCENVNTLKVVSSVIKVVGYILDRNACLFPAYFAVNEISKLGADDQLWPHWMVGNLLADFVQSFRGAAQMVTVSGRSNLLPVVGHSSSTANVWKLNPHTLRFSLTGPLPYDKELNEPQTSLLRYVLEQPYSRDMVCNMLSLNKQVKQRCTVLEDQLVDLVVLAMERSEGEEVNSEDGESQFLWQHLSSQVIFFVLFQFASFPDMVLALYEKLKGRNLKKGRDHLMWVLLQFISGSIQKNPLGDFLPVMKLYDLLYNEKEPIVVPDYNRAVSTHSMAVTCIWIHLNKKAQNDHVKLHRPIPHALQKHLEFLKMTLSTKALPMTDYRIALLCNAYSTNNEYFSLPMGVLVESIYGNTNQGSTLLPNNIQASAPVSPLRMSLLDSLTVHAKMSLIHSIVTRVMRLAQSKTSMTLALAPALVETYSRLLVYMEIESLGIKGFITQLLPSVFKSNAWGILHTLLEMFSYRLHHIQPHYRVQLLSHLHTLASVPQTNQNQLHICVESTALRLIMGLGSSEVHPQLSRVINETKTMNVSTESEELNRALVLTLARAMHVTGSESTNWCREILIQIMQYTPHAWSSHTLTCFPPALAEFFNQSQFPKDDKDSLKRSVDAEYRKWKSMAGENDLIAHFSMQGTPPLFLCVLWRSLLEDDRISPTAYKVLERLGPRILSTHLRTFAEYLVNEFSSSGGGQQVNKFVEKLSDMIWKCHVVTVDRLVLCLALRSLEGSEAHVCFFIIQLLLLKPSEFRVRVQEFVKDNSPCHWEEKHWHEKHMAFHKKFPEKFYYEGLQDINTQSSFQYLPIYFGNVCLRFIPVFDIVIHRFLELPGVSKNLESLLDHLGTLYKFHDRPVTFLYNTLHYYERILKERPALKKKLVSVIIGSLKEIRPANWCLSEDFCQYLGWNQEDAEQRQAEDTSWQPTQDYYIRLMNRLVDTIAGKIPLPFPNFDWRFNEFPNPSAHALYVTCIELMALPVSSNGVGTALLDIILKGSTQIPRDKIMSWMNAVGLVLTSLPDTYWQVLNERIIETLKSPHLATPGLTNPFQAFNFSVNHHVVGEMYSSYVLALCHAVWQHASIGQLSMLPIFLRDHLKPVVKTEEQYILVCHLVGPFLQRFHSERTRCLLDLTVELYEMLEQVDNSSEHMSNIDPIADFLYHIKYMFVGDGVKHEVEKVIRNLRQSLQMRLRFISHHGREDSQSSSQILADTSKIKS